jgi:hypothetical protein
MKRHEKHLLAHLDQRQTAEVLIEWRPIIFNEDVCSTSELGIPLSVWGGEEKKTRMVPKAPTHI